MTREQLNHFAWFIECFHDENIDYKKMIEMFNVSASSLVVLDCAIDEYLKVNNIKLNSYGCSEVDINFDVNSSCGSVDRLSKINEAVEQLRIVSKGIGVNIIASIGICSTDRLKGAKIGYIDKDDIVFEDMKLSKMLFPKIDYRILQRQKQDEYTKEQNKLRIKHSNKWRK